MEFLLDSLWFWEGALSPTWHNFISYMHMYIIYIAYPSPGSSWINVVLIPHQGSFSLLIIYRKPQLIESAKLWNPVPANTNTSTTQLLHLMFTDHFGRRDGKAVGTGIFLRIFLSPRNVRIYIHIVCMAAYVMTSRTY